jgi:pyruvate dehydrogenase E1 component alpha subunit
MRPDTRAYRQREEEVEWREQRDPVAVAQQELGKAGILAREDAERIDRAIAKEIDDAVAFAERSPDPELSEMFTDVYAPF